MRTSPATQAREAAIPAPTPHDLSQLAWTRRQNPDLAMEIATEAGRLSDKDKTAGKPVMKERGYD